MASEAVLTAATNAETARSRVGATMDDIQDRLSPRRIVAEVVDKVQTGSRVLVEQAGDAAKAHPVALGTAVAALGLGLLARNRLSRATVNLGEGAHDYTDYDDGYGEETYVVPRFQGLASTAPAAGSAPTPGISIIVGLLAGAILGALLPVSETERRTLADAGGRLGAAARAAARAASDELGAAGLSLDSVRAKAGEATTRARQAAQSVMDAARAELKN